MFSSLVYWMLTVGVKCDAGCDNLICCCRLWPHGGSVEQCHWVIQCILVFSSCLDNLEIWPVSVNANISCEILWYKHFKDVICPYFDPQRPGTSLWGAWLSCIYSVFPLLIQSVSIKCQTSFNSGEAEVSVWLISSLMFTFVFSFFRWIHQNFKNNCHLKSCWSDETHINRRAVFDTTPELYLVLTLVSKTLIARIKVSWVHFCKTTDENLMLSFLFLSLLFLSLSWCSGYV